MITTSEIYERFSDRIDGMNHYEFKEGKEAEMFKRIKEVMKDD